MVGSDDILSADRIAAVGKMAVVFDKWFPGKKLMICISLFLIIISLKISRMEPDITQRLPGNSGKPGRRRSLL